MLLLGLLLLVGSAAFTAMLIADNLTNLPEYRVTVLDQGLATMNVLEIFLSGLALALLFSLGLWMMKKGTAWKARKAVSRRRERKSVRETERERDELAARLAQEREERAAERPATPGYGEQPAGYGVPEGEPADERHRAGAGGSRHRNRLHLFGH